MFTFFPCIGVNTCSFAQKAKLDFIRRTYGWKADDHEFGRGKVHLVKLEPDDKWDDYDPAGRKRLLCGRWLDTTRGTSVTTVDETEITCGGCKQKYITLQERPEQEARRAERYAQWQAGHLRIHPHLGGAE